MHWYHYLALLFGGMVLSNAVPHFINGVSGNCFPTPFSRPIGAGLSSPFLNVIWGTVNMLVGYLLLRAGRLRFEHVPGMLVFIAGVFIVGTILSIFFPMTDRDK
jgi:hypothetical protein